MCAVLPKLDFGDFIGHEPELVIRHCTHADAATKCDEINQRTSFAETATAASGGGDEFRCAQLLAVRLIPLSAYTLREPLQAIVVVAAPSRLPRLKSAEHASAQIRQHGCTKMNRRARH